MATLSCPSFAELEREIVEDFMSCLQENVDAIEDCLNQLDGGSDIELINRLFRDIHSFKGNCRMVFLDPVVEITHTLEEIVQDMRQEQRTYIPAYRLFFTEIIFRTVNMIRDLYEQGEIDSAPKDELLTLIQSVHQSCDEEVNPVLEKALIQLVGEVPTELFKKDGDTATSVQIEIQQEQDESDLAYFKQVSVQLDGLNELRKDRTKNVLRLCLETNKELGNPVDDDQLTAAVYLHDLGMALVPQTILDKTAQLTPDEFTVIRRHTIAGAGFLKRIPGWEEAAVIVEQHHEKFDGTGYPAKLRGDQIHPGARIVALADAFFSVTNKRADRSTKKSLFSAVSLINGESGMQFDPDYVEGFNESVRRLFVGKK